MITMNPKVQKPHWPFTVNASDSAAIRSSSVTASTPTFSKLFVSAATPPPYSATFGQAFSPSSNGDGSWGTAVGGPGGNLNRTNYEQFTVTATTGNTIRIDSLIMNAAFYNSSSNTRIAIVYSLSGFVSDSTNITGVISPFASSDSIVQSLL